MTLTRRSSIAHVAATVSAALQEAGFTAVLTGGACAAIYSDGAYQSHDLDFILQSGGTQRALDAAMARAGFRRTGDRFVHPHTRFFVEFPAGPLAIGDDTSVKPSRLAIGAHTVLALSATDACRDRLAAFYYWSDRQSLQAAIAIAVRHRVNMAAIRRWSLREHQAEKFEEFREAVRSARRRRV